MSPHKRGPRLKKKKKLVLSWKEENGDSKVICAGIVQTLILFANFIGLNEESWTRESFYNPKKY